MKIKRIISGITAFAAALCISAEAFAANTPVSVKENAYTTVLNVGSGKMLNVYGNKSAKNTNVTVCTKDGTTGQQFMFKPSAAGSGLYYLVPQCAPKMSVNVYASTAKNKDNVCLWTVTNSKTQAWKIEKTDGGNYIFRCADNTKLVLTAASGANGANVCIQNYSEGNKYQLWSMPEGVVDKNAVSASSPASVATSVYNDAVTALTAAEEKTEKKAEVKTVLTAEDVKKQIPATYEKAKTTARRKSFNGYCGTYVRYQLIALSIIKENSDFDCNGNGNQWYKNVKSGKTSTGYTKTKYAGKDCLSTIAKKYNGNVQNIVVSYTHQGGMTDKAPGKGHVVFIHAIINNKVYYSESFDLSKNNPSGSVLVKSLSDFEKTYTKNYGNALGAIVFTK